MQGVQVYVLYGVCLVISSQPPSLGGGWMDPASRGQRSYLAFGYIEQPDVPAYYERLRISHVDRVALRRAHRTRTHVSCSYYIQRRNTAYMWEEREDIQRVRSVGCVS